MNILRQLDEFKTLLQDMLRKLDNIGKLLQQLVDAQEDRDEGVYTITIDELDGFMEYMNWTGQEGQND